MSTNGQGNSTSEAPPLMKATLASIAVAALILITLVLPAEFGLDPLGTGELLGLTGLAEPEPVAVLPEPSAYRTDAIRFELMPFESVEYKYRLEQGAALLYSWQATGETVYDLHAEPDGAPEGYAESFDQGRGGSANGAYVARFPGIHGWFWENRGSEPVSVNMMTAGFYDHAIEFRDGFQTRHEAPAVRPDTPE